MRLFYSQSVLFSIYKIQKNSVYSWSGVDIGCPVCYHTRTNGCCV
nr:MAG TPA: hypothetical protein [Caudoviricetes sp.]